ncbi:MAG: cytochrome C [Gammaproteobacteria bacterium]|nr:cytochrome C [Gammaproteobacteria bacterium]
MLMRMTLASGCLLALTGTGNANELSAKEQLGFSLFFDKNLSLNGNQACADCHLPAAGWTGHNSDINAHGAAYEGSVIKRFSNRKPPSAAYAAASPVLHFDKKEAIFIGGNFWDGRATGEKLGNPAADQALGPFLNPLEQALPDNSCVIHRVCNAEYPVSLDSIWTDACDIAWPDNMQSACAGETSAQALAVTDRDKVDQAYAYVGLAIAAFEASTTVNPYTSKYDYYLAGRVKLSEEETRGMELFKGKAKCAACHPMEPGVNSEPPLFTDFSFDNLGVPRNPENPWYTMPKHFNPQGRQWVDKGLGEFLAQRDEYRQYAEENLGKQKVPTVRNVDKRPYETFVKAYMHNGYFKTLKGLVNFYNTRDTKPVCKNPLTTEADALQQQCWPPAELTTNVNQEELGDLQLSDAEENAIVVFMQTLSDGYQPPNGVALLRNTQHKSIGVTDDVNQAKHPLTH